MANPFANSSAVPVTDYPIGQKAKSRNGPGIFVDQEGERILVWVDVALTGRINIIHRLLAEGAEIATQHWDSDVHLIILSPASVRIFDMYCHPDYMRLAQYARHFQRRRRRFERGRGEEAWTSKVMLKEDWVDKCFTAGRFLGEADSWAGLRAGGPIATETMVLDLQTDLSLELPIDPLKEMPIDSSKYTTADAPKEMAINHPEIQVIPATQKTGSPISVIEDQDIDVENTAEEPVPSIETAKVEGVDTATLPAQNGIQVTSQTSDDTPMRPFAITDSVLMEREGSGSGSQAMEIDPRSSPPAKVEGAFPRASTDATELVDAASKQLYDEDEGSTPQARPSSPVTIMRERDGELEIVPSEDSEEEEETIETPRIPHQRTSGTAEPLPAEPDIVGNSQPEASAEDEEEDEVERDMAMEVDHDGYATEDLETNWLPSSVQATEAVPEPTATEQTVEQFSSQVSLEVEAPRESTEVNDTNAEAGPSTTRFQSPQKVDDPSKLFEGYRFWVDLKRPNRTDLIRRIRAAGGQLVMTYDQATHVLVHDHKSPMWPSIIADVVKRGVWFMDFKWIVKCLNDSIRYPELGDHLVGGAPILLTHIAPPSRRMRKRERGSESASLPTPTAQRIEQSPSSVSRDESTGAAPHDADEIARQFQLALHRSGGVVNQAVQRMQQSMPDKGYSAAKWEGLYVRWRRRTGRFAHIARVQPSVMEMRPVLRSLEDRVKEGKLCHGEVLHELHDEFPSTYPSHEDWDTIWTAWMSKNGRFKPDSSRTTVKVEHSPSRAEVSPTQRRGESSMATPAIRPPPSSKMGAGYLSIEELGEIFEREAPKVDRGEITKSQIGELLHEAYGKYSVGTWKNLLLEWRRGEGRFDGSRAQHSITASSQSGISSQVARDTISQTGDRPAFSRGSGKAISDEEMGRIFSSHWPSYEAGTPAIAIAQIISQSHPAHGAPTWVTFFGEWRRGQRRFAAHGPNYMNPNPPTSQKKYRKDGGNGVSEPMKLKSSPPANSPSVEVAAASPESSRHGQPYTENELKAMGHYIIDRLPRPTGPTPAHWEEFSTKIPGRTPGAWSQKLYSKRDQIHPYAEAYAKEQGKLEQYQVVAQLGAHAATSQGPSSSADLKAVNSLPTKSSVSQVTTSMPVDTNADNARQGQPYSDEERKMMAKYIVDRLPARTCDNSVDWKPFAANHPERTFGAWSQKGSDYQVFASAREIAVERGKLAQFDKAHPRLARVLEPADVIKIDSDSDDPEFVDMTGIDSDYLD